MADNTKIEWSDATWNPITGCSVVSPGCTNCYAMRLAGTRLQHHPSRAGLTRPTKAGPVWTGDVRFNAEWLDQPLRWRRPRMIFVCAHGDLFHESVPNEWIDKVFAVMALAAHHRFQVLTKRPERMRAYVSTIIQRSQEIAMAAKPLRFGTRYDSAYVAAHRRLTVEPLPNVWLGVSVEDQARADERIPPLLDTPAAVRWISAEPLLAEIDVTRWLHDSDCYMLHKVSGEMIDCTCSEPREVHLDWVVTGGESGPGARPAHPDWERSLRDQCAAAGVPYLRKQAGDWQAISQMTEDEIESLYEQPPEHDPEGYRRCKVDQLIMHRSGRTFPLDQWSWVSGENRSSGDFAFAAGSGAMHMFRMGKKAAGRLLDGVEHNGMPR